MPQQEDEVINWQGLFFPSVPVLELILRGSLVYLAIFALLRFVVTHEKKRLGRLRST
ncbi:MAG: hypothetical protein M3410_04565 [Acidobacteriota bacterium]|nr:hypothetical protein [Acidobacteriota bacterium]